jgi:streptogramin lyase
MHHLRSNRFACIAFALALAGCGGGANSSTPAVLPSAASGNTTSNAQSVAVTFSIVVPKAASAHTRRAQYVSTATATASIKVNSGTVQTGSCTSVSCVVTVNAPVGSDTFVVQLLDNTSDVLSQGSMSQTISGTAANTVTLAFDGVPSTVILTAATTHFVPGLLSSSSVITAVVKDAAGDTIIGTDPYVDSTGTTNPITLTTTNATDTSFSTTSLTSPATSTSTLTYTGASAAAGTTLSIGATATSITPTPATISVYAHHTILEYPVPGGGTPYGAALGADGNVWFVEEAVAKVGHVAPDGTITLYTIPSGGDGFAIAAGSDSRLWFTENNGKIGAVTTGGTVSEYTSGVSDPFGIAKGANGNMFYVDFSGSGLVGQITTSGSTSFSSGLSGGPQLQGIALGSDDRVWVTEPFGGTDQFVALDTSFNATYYNTTAGAQMRGITLGPSDNLWFCDGYNGNGGNNAIGKIHDDGTGFAEYAIPTSGGSCETITEGSDGLMYFTEINGNKIGVLTTGATPTITEYTIPTASSSPQGITTGADGNIWFTELAGNKIGRYIL